MFEKVTAAQTVRPPWLRPWGVSASAAAHAVVALAIVSIPVPAEPPPRTVETATFLVLLQTPRVPDRLSRVLADAKQAALTAPRVPFADPGSQGGKASPSVANLRLALPGEATAVPEMAPVPTSVDEGPGRRSLAAAAEALSRRVRGAALLAGGTAADEDVVAAELLAEPPRMMNQREISRLLGRLYPFRLRAAGVEGDVTLTFIIGRDGRVEMRSVTVVASAHPELTEPTLRALAMMRFRPARVSGEAVRVRVTLPVRWVLQGRLAQSP
ncbi:MAG TPA: energy transducer TonB [Longimicrobium sp.]|nr:energy transducer TonB [Longimicrobium sp.]